MAKKKTQKTQHVRTHDGFRNFVTQLGVSPEAHQNKISGGHYGPNLITKNRIQLEWAYRGNWIAGQVVDTYSEDMTREGITITSNDEPDNARDLHEDLVKLQINQSMTEGNKLGRLYGGAIGVLQILGQDPSIPLEIDTVSKDQFKGIAVYDRWQLQPDLTDVIQDGPDLGLPTYYDIVTNYDYTKPANESGIHPASGHKRIHHSRCVRFMGIKLPFFQAVTEQMWGESVLERLWDRLIAFDETTMSVANLVDLAKLRMIKIKDLRQIIAGAGVAYEKLIESIELTRRMQRNEGLTIIDAEDEYSTDTYAFGGLSDIMLQFGQQISGSCQIPLVRLFGQSPAGLSATGESDMRMYYDNIKTQQESRLRPGYDKIIKVAYRSKFGESAPADLNFFFNPLWQLSDLDKATVNKTNAETIIAAHQQGGITTAGMMRQLRESGGEDGLFSHITDEDIEEADSLQPPLPNEMTEGSLNQNPPKEITSGPPPQTQNEPAVKNIDAIPDKDYESLEDRKILKPLKWFSRGAIKAG